MPGTRPGMTETADGVPTVSGKRSPVMVGLVPAIHVFAAERLRELDAQHKAGHDGESG
jgi:hypothetical protein